MALFNRSLRVEARSIWTYLVRLGLVGTISLMLLTTWVSSLMTNAPGLIFFTQVIYVDLIIIIGVGIAYFSSAITEEKEEMTLGLLIMTGLNPISILMGKSTSRMIGLIFLLLAQFPFTLLAITLGGVSMTQVLAAYVCLLSFAVFIGNLSLFCSVFCQRARGAAVLATVFFILFLCLPLLFELFEEILESTWSNSAGTIAVLERMGEKSFAMNPFMRLEEIRWSGFAGSPVSFQATSNVVGGCLFFLLSYAIFNWRTREQKVAAPSRGIVLKAGGKGQWISAGRCWSKPLLWKDFNFLTGGKGAFIVKTLALLLLGGVVYFYNYQWRRLNGGVSGFEGRILRSTGEFILQFSWLACALELAIQAGRVFKSEVKWGTHSSLMTLPLPPGSMVTQKIVGCLLGIIPYFVFLIIGMILVPSEVDSFFSALFRGDGEGLALLIIFFGAFVLWLYLTAFYSLILKWGALPLALLTVFMGTQCVTSAIMIPMTMMSAMVSSFFDSIWPFFFIITIFLTVLITFLHRGIGKQLAKAASDGQ